MDYGEGQDAGFGSAQAVGDGLGQRDGAPLAGLERQKRVVAVGRLDAEETDRGAHVLGDGGATGEQSAAADRGDQGIQLRGVFQQLQRRGSLPCHDHRMIEGWHQSGAGLFENAGGDSLAAFPEAVIRHDASAIRARAFKLGTRCVGGHHDGGGGSCMPGGDGHCNGVITGGKGHHAAGGMERIRLAAPRILNAPPVCKFSHLKKTRAPAAASNSDDAITGVRLASGRIRATAARTPSAVMAGTVRL